MLLRTREVSPRSHFRRFLKNSTNLLLINSTSTTLFSQVLCTYTTCNLHVVTRLKTSGAPCLHASARLQTSPQRCACSTTPELLELHTSMLPRRHASNALPALYTSVHAVIPASRLSVPPALHTSILPPAQLQRLCRPLCFHIPAPYTCSSPLDVQSSIPPRLYAFKSASETPCLHVYTPTAAPFQRAIPECLHIGTTAGRLQGSRDPYLHERFRRECTRNATDPHYTLS